MFGYIYIYIYIYMGPNEMWKQERSQTIVEKGPFFLDFEYVRVVVQLNFN